MKINTIQYASELLEACQEWPANSTIFVDVDNTLLMTLSKACRAAPNLIDEIKKDKANIPNFVDLLSHWRLMRKVMLVDPNWPAVLTALQQKYQVYGLTKVDTGHFGVIPSMEVWRHNELKQFGLSFSLSAALQDYSTAIKQSSPAGPVFYQGILMTGKASKPETLELFQSILQLKSIVFIDDRLEQLGEVAGFCDLKQIKFQGVHFTGIDRFNEPVSPDVVAFQRNMLLTQGRWLEDEEAEALIAAPTVH